LFKVNPALRAVIGTARRCLPRHLERQEEASAQAQEFRLSEAGGAPRAGGAGSSGDPFKANARCSLYLIVGTKLQGRSIMSSFLPPLTPATADNLWLVRKPRGEEFTLSHVANVEAALAESVRMDAILGL
jgi:hypothetical protein